MLCCTHTGLPYAQDYPHPEVVVNNGCAGLPNFRGSRHGVLTRLSADAEPPADSLYGISIGGLRVDALPVDYDHDAWMARFLDRWPPCTPAHRNYYDCIEYGTWLTPEQSARGSVTCTL